MTLTTSTRVSIPPEAGGKSDKFKSGSMIEHRDVAGQFCNGKFTPLQTDFSLFEDASDITGQGQYRDRNDWTSTQREKVKKFRFVVCTLSLIALTSSLMSRSILNVAIVEMTKDVTTLDHQAEETPEATTIPQVVKTIMLSDDPNNPNPEIISVFTVNESSDEDPEVGLHFSWSVGATNFLLSSFYIGYAPSMFFSGGIAEKYGSKFPLLICVFGTAIINFATPFLASFSYLALVSSRIVLGLLQGALVPACYDIFNKWLTITEMSIFVSLIKVSMAFGTLLGTIIPGFVSALAFDWTYNFYLGSLICAIWSLFWFPLASSTPQTNKWIYAEELERIMRKKSIVNVITLNSIEDTKNNPDVRATKVQQTTSIPWLQIVSNPSVLALTLVKFTYNFGGDFLVIESAIYLNQMHDASTETVTLIAGIGCFMQMLFITPVGWIAKTLVHNETFRLSRTKWRKIFQGGSNFAIATVYLLLPFVGQDLMVVAILFIVVYFCWMFGAGGESMVPYDLSPKYPATIMGFAHSISTISGFTLPSVCSLVLGDDKKDGQRWNVLFFLIGAASAFGGLVFVLVLKAKPFIASEREKFDRMTEKIRMEKNSNNHNSRA